VALGATPLLRRRSEHPEAAPSAVNAG